MWFLLIHADPWTHNSQSLHEPRKVSSSFWAGQKKSIIKTTAKACMLSQSNGTPPLSQYNRASFPGLPSVRSTFNQVKPPKPAPSWMNLRPWVISSHIQDPQDTLLTLFQLGTRKLKTMFTLYRPLCPNNIESFATFHPIPLLSLPLLPKHPQTSCLLKSSPRSGWRKWTSIHQVFYGWKNTICAISHQGARSSNSMGSEWMGKLQEGLFQVHCHPTVEHISWSNKIFPYHQGYTMRSSK